MKQDKSIFASKVYDITMERVLDSCFEFKNIPFQDSSDLNDSTVRAIAKMYVESPSVSCVSSANDKIYDVDSLELQVSCKYLYEVPDLLIRYGLKFENNFCQLYAFHTNSIDSPNIPTIC